ncbi:MAG: hypothetical protein HoeaKO_40420 [Hoeflea alexandrii]
MARIRSLLLVPLVVLLSGCLSVTPRGLVAMAGFNPLQMNPAELGAGLGVPQSIRLADGDAMIAMTWQVRGEAAPRVNERFLLQISDSSEIVGMPPPLRGERIYVGRLSRLDSVRMRDVQERILRHKSEGLVGQGSFSINLRGGCTTASPLTELPFRTFVKTGSDSSWIETTRRSDFVATLPAQERKEFLQSVRICNGTG